MSEQIRTVDDVLELLRERAEYCSTSAGHCYQIGMGIYGNEWKSGQAELELMIREITRRRAVTYIEADVPLPETPTVEGEVVQ